MKCVECPKSVAQAERCKLQFNYPEQCLVGFELFVVRPEHCGIGNIFTSNIKPIVAMVVWSESGKNDPLYSPTSFTHHVTINNRHNDTNTSYDSY